MASLAAHIIMRNETATSKVQMLHGWTAPNASGPNPRTEQIPTTRLKSSVLTIRLTGAAKASWEVLV